MKNKWAQMSKLFSILILMLLFPGVDFGAGTFTSTEKLQLRMLHQYAQIHREARIGKLTTDQVKTLETQVEAVRQQEMSDVKLNNSKMLTNTQIFELSRQLDTISKSIPIK